jgi:hypothetical protein
MVCNLVDRCRHVGLFCCSSLWCGPSTTSIRRAQIPGARSSWRLNFIRWRLIIVGPQYGTCLILPFWPPKVWGRFRNFGKFMHLCVRICLNYTASYSKRSWSWYVLPQQPQISPWFFVPSLILETKFYTHTIQHVKFYLVSFIPCINDNIFTLLNQQNA